MKKLFLFIPLLLIVGCQGLQKAINNVQKPTLAVTDVRITDFNFNEIELTYDVRVNNPNPIALHMLGYDYNLKIDGNNFVKGTQDKSLDIASSASSTFEIPMRVNFQDLYHLFSELKNKDEADYKMLAHLNFNLPVVGKTKLPISKSGNLPMIKLPKINVTDLTVNDVNFNRARMNLQLQVDNPNGFGLLVNALSYDLNVNGRNWIKGNRSENTTINKNGSSRLSIPLTVNIAKIGTSVVQLLQHSEKANFKLNGHFNFGAKQKMLKHLKTDFSFDKTGKLSINH